jgi:hypothetical protein
MLKIMAEVIGLGDPPRSRPKARGLWVRVTYSDGQTIEGIVRNDLLHLHPWQGVVVSVTKRRESKGQVYELGIPRCVMMNFEVLGVIGIPRDVPGIKKNRR